jgi:ubiquinone/menaquinone biosynthesis C-methylase UbiE
MMGPSRSDDPTVQVKSLEEARATVLREARANRGFLRPRHTIALLVLAMAAALVLPWSVTILTALGAILVLDFAVFVGRRLRTLRAWERGCPRLGSPADFHAVDVAYQRAGIRHRTMSDYERVTGSAHQPAWRTDLRYEELLEVRGEKPLEAAVDVGAGDGRLAWKYGIHKTARIFVGLDLAFDLLRVLREKLPAAGAIQGDANAGLPLKTSSVDFLSCTTAFEEFMHPDDALREFARVMRPGGRVVIQSPAATRLRNLNPLHVLQCVIGIWAPKILLPTIVHEHTFVRAYTYNRDFTTQQMRQWARPLGLRMTRLVCTTSRFNPGGSWWHRLGNTVSRQVPILNRLGWDMTIVLEKT